MLLHGYSIAIERSRALGQPVNFLVEVSPDGLVALTPIAEGTVASEHGDPESRASDFSRSDPLAAARERGRLRAAEILAGEEMVSADVFATLLGTTRVTVNTKRQGGLLLGLDGAKRGFRFPLWQLDADGVPYAQISALHERLGGPWAVYRFLMQPHGELGGLTGLEALKRGKSLAVIDAAESVTRGSH
ncbi:XRE family transcriptional regulator [Caulobacter zeae]|uniref:XRE family transcriptional regulator n=2 Tax=Caulobacter zeae TaxID=2055137 RepID=A0A2N5DGB0_9CAUL|nr:XRE family transcriptional regulator [Caulobacter zeae]